MKKKKVILEVEYDFEEYKQVYLDSLSRIPIFAGVFKYPLNIVLTVAISLVILYFYGQFSIPVFLIAFSFINVFLASFSRIAGVIFKKWLEILAKHHFQTEGEPLVLRKTFIFADVGIQVISGKNPIKTDFNGKIVDWFAVDKAVENEKGIFIFYDKYLLEFIPKRAFDVYEESSSLKSFIREKIGDRAEF